MNRADMMRGHAHDYYRQARGELRRARIAQGYGDVATLAQCLRDARALRHKARIHMAQARGAGLS